MKSLEEIKDKVAQDNGCQNWNDLEESNSANEQLAYIPELMKEAQKEAVKEQSQRNRELDETPYWILQQLIKEIDNQ
jgi:hypothetical protein